MQTRLMATEISNFLKNLQTITSHIDTLEASLNLSITDQNRDQLNNENERAGKRLFNGIVSTYPSIAIMIEKLTSLRASLEKEKQTNPNPYFILDMFNQALLVCDQEDVQSLVEQIEKLKKLSHHLAALGDRGKEAAGVLDWFVVQLNQTVKVKFIRAQAVEEAHAKTQVNNLLTGSHGIAGLIKYQGYLAQETGHDKEQGLLALTLEKRAENIANDTERQTHLPLSRELAYRKYHAVSQQIKILTAEEGSYKEKVFQFRARYANDFPLLKADRSPIARGFRKVVGIVFNEKRADKLTSFFFGQSNGAAIYTQAKHEMYRPSNR